MRGARAGALIVLAAAVVAAGALLPRLGAVPVWSKDEARPGLVARDAVERGYWLVPHLGDRLYPDKPPLFPWVVALAARGHVTEWALRLPSVLAAAVTVGAATAVGMRVAGGAGGLVAGAFLLSTFTFYQWGRTGRGEALLVCWMTLGLWSLHRWLDEGRRRDAVLLGLWTGLGLLTKGPIALLPLGAAVASAAAVGATSRRIRDTGVALVVAAIVVAAWLVATLRDMPFAEYAGALNAAFNEEIVQRPARAPLYALGVVSAGLMPWTLAMPGALVVVARAWRRAWRPLLPAVVTCLLLVFVFTVVVPAREVYFLPLYPVLAVILAWAWSECPPRGRPWVLGPVLAGAAVLAVAGAVLVVRPVTVVLQGWPMVIDRGVAAALAIEAAAVVALVPLVGLVRRPLAAALVVAAGALAVVATVELGIQGPAESRAYPTRAAAARFAAHVPAGADVVIVDRRLETALGFYWPRPPLLAPSLPMVIGLTALPRTYALLTLDELLSVVVHYDADAEPVYAEDVDRILYVLAVVTPPHPR